jgi:hypothetical protein
MIERIYTRETMKETLKSIMRERSYALSEWEKRVIRTAASRSDEELASICRLYFPEIGVDDLPVLREAIDAGLV